MAMVQIVNADGEINAAIMKGVLENMGIKATYAPIGHSRGSGSLGASQRHMLYVEEFDKDNALSILMKEGLITPESI